MSTRRVVYLVLTALALIGVFGVRSTLARRVEISAPGPQRIVHDGQDRVQVFREVVWEVRGIGQPRGVTVQWTCGPFVHAVEPSSQVDCELAIRVLESQGASHYTAVVPVDRTNLSTGDFDALVVARSRRTGRASIGLTVSFLNAQFATLMTGDYCATVVGTIVGN